MSRAESPEKQDQVTSPRMGGDGGDENAESGKLHLALSAFLLCSPTEGLSGGDGGGKHPDLRAISTELKCDGVRLADGW